MGFRVRALERATHDVGLRLVARLRDVGLSQAEIHVIGYLADAGPSSIGAVHGSFGHRRSTLTSVLDRLERRGLVARAVNAADRRSFLVSLTPAGLAAGARVQAEVADLEAAVAAQAGMEDGDAFDHVVEALAVVLGGPPDG